jgi:hypothetical protein
VTCAGKQYLEMWESGFPGVYKRTQFSKISAEKRAQVNDSDISLGEEADEKIFKGCFNALPVAPKESEIHRPAAPTLMILSSASSSSSFVAEDANLNAELSDGDKVGCVWL